MFNKNDGESNKNLFLVLFLCMGFMLTYQYFFENKHTEPPAQQQTQIEEIQNTPNITEKTISIEEAKQKPSRIYIENSKLKGSIDLEGCVIDSIILKNYKQTVENNSQNIDILCPKNTNSEYYYSTSYFDRANSEAIDENTIWEKIESNGDNKITLSTKTKSGLIIERSIILDNGYLIRINDKLINISDNPISIINASDIIRREPVISNYAVVHEGLIGLNNITGNSVEEIKYNKIKEKINLGTSKWFGYTDIYWLVSHINTNDNIITYNKENENTYKVSLHSKRPTNIKAKSTVNIDYSLFAGPKDMSILKDYSKDMAIPKFDMAIDFGWFFILTKPTLYLLDQMAKLFSNMGVVILLITLIFKLLTYPLTKKSMYSIARMKEIQPKILNLQKMYASDKQRINLEMMALYKKEKISPMSGCLPMLFQAPIFFCLYKVFFISIEMRHAPLFLWIKDLSSADPLYITNLFGLINWDPPKFLQLGVWPLIMGLTMLIQQKISSASSKNSKFQKTPEAKMQENMMYLMPIMFTFVCANFPVGVVIYWTISNLLSSIQQIYINKHIKKHS